MIYIDYRISINSSNQYGVNTMSLYEIRCCKQCEAIKAYAKLLGICEEWAAYRWCVYGHAARFAKYYKDGE